jgi:hypothetical protein
MANEHNPENLPALLDGIMAEGGLKIFGGDDTNPLGSYFQQAEDIFDRMSIMNAKQLISAILLVHSLDDARTVGFLLAEGMKRGLLHKGDLATMYLWQSESTRTLKPLLTLDDLWQIPHRAFPRRHDDQTPLAAGFTREEIIALAERVKEIHQSDITTFFQQWFYRSNKPLPFSKEFLLRYYDDRGWNRPSGKLAALVAIALFNTYPECVTMSDIKERMLNLAERNPESHGIFRYLSLMFCIAGEDEEKRKFAIDAYVELAITIVRKSVSYFPGPSMAIEFFLGESGITASEKKAGMRKIHKACKEKAQVYADIIKATREQLRAL